MVGSIIIQIAHTSVLTVTVYPIPVYTLYNEIVLRPGSNLSIPLYARIMPSL
jgi:hypothetical protein